MDTVLCHGVAVPTSRCSAFPRCSACRGPIVTSAACLLVVRVDGDHIGFAVGALRSIDPLVWGQRKSSAAVAAPDPAQSDLARALSTASLVTVGDSGRLLPDLDLRAVARTFKSRMSAADSVAAAGERAPAAVASAHLEPSMT